MEPPAAARTRPKRLRLPGVLGVCCCCWGGPPGSQLDEDEEEINEEEIDEEERSDEEGDYGEDDWYDICVRRPLLGVAGARAIAISVVHHPDRTTDSFTYRQPSVPGGCCHLAIGSYAEDTEPTQISSGLAVWDASVHLCRHLLADPDLCRTKRVLELGSGTGKAGLLAHHLRKDVAPSARGFGHDAHGR
ncbi:hypothetical protein THAOC_35895 [Thalassiosira oceanica]|uniref:Uncharacterized protein n=1 Tax=Thalassiosira oceanica TaxID=159749 RepID=K0R2P1_THAOC|nr:hypothetical protein THAOC_35895 [Thalassiosira oceanica]|eukprot:EJK45489.1 hypothetical protein THAOC_35895 [Thalassiosira oceanica]